MNKQHVERLKKVKGGRDSFKLSRSVRKISYQTGNIKK